MYESLSSRLANAFKSFKNKGKLTESDVKEGMREIKLALLEADVNYKVVKDFIKTATERAVGAEVLESLVPSQQIVKIVNEELTKLMGGENSKLVISSKPPTIVMMCGLQGAGKTTHTGKLALMYKKQGKRPLLAACDVYRPAAIKQLRVIGQSIDVPVFTIEGCTDPVEIAQKALEHAKKHGHDMLFLDTAGRLHVDEKLMDELKEIKEKLLAIGDRLKEKYKAEFDAAKAPYIEAVLAGTPAHLRKTAEYELQFIFGSDGWFLLHCIVALLDAGKLRLPKEEQRKALMTLIFPK